MKICNIEPDVNVCEECLNMTETCGVYDVDCRECHLKTDVYELISVGSNFFGAFGIVVKDGKAETIPLHKIINIKDMEEQNGG
jgi:hypothetical protein